MEDSRISEYFPRANIEIDKAGICKLLGTAYLRRIRLLDYIIITCRKGEIISILEENQYMKTEGNLPQIIWCIP